MHTTIATALATLLLVAASVSAQPANPPRATAAMPPAAVQSGGTDVDALRTAMRGDKRAFVASTLALTPAEAKRFWPIYDTYQRAVDVVARTRATTAESLLSHDKGMSGLAAKSYVAQNAQADDAEVRARRKMVTATMKALPPLKGARYVQLESKFRAVQAYDIAQAFPLIQ